MPLTRSRDLNSAPQETDEEKKARDKAYRRFKSILEDAADEKDAVLITVLKDIGTKNYGNGEVQRYICRIIILTGEHAGYVNGDVTVNWGGWTNRIKKAVASEGLGAHMVSRLGRYGDRTPQPIGLEDDQDGDVELAEAALKKHGDPFEDAAPGHLTDGVADTKAKAKAKAAAEKDLEEPPF
jgi:hypothetical protein